jgi:transposase-like protein
VEAAENPRGRGRPGHLTVQLIERIEADVMAGATFSEAARLAGVSPRTLRSWRARAWSHRREDVLHVQLEQRLQHALQVTAHTTPSWEQIAATVVANENWLDEFRDDT